MNHKIIFSVMGRLLNAFSLMLLLPTLVSLIYDDKDAYAFLISAGISLMLGIILRLITRKPDKALFAKEGFLIVALAWICASLIGALPFYISGAIPSFVNALFETVSGFTTTGASILTDIEALSKSMLFWRSFTHWIGGMGVLVFIIAFVNGISENSIHILRAEMPGPIIGKLMPRSKDTSKILYIMYIVLTIAEIIFLWCGDMDLYESIVHTFGTAGTGGFSVKSASIGAYSPYSQWVISVFMVIFGINFNIYYLMILKRFKEVLKSEELWTYLGIITGTICLIIINTKPLFDNIYDTIRHSVFQVTSIITTTGYATTDFNQWPDFSKAVLLILMFSGACAGSTAGGLKISRTVLLFKMISKEIKQMIRPRSVSDIKFEGKSVDKHTQNSVTAYFAVYMVCLLFIFLIVSFDSFGFETNFSATVACFNNVGPGFGMVGPIGCFDAYSWLSKVMLMLAMLLGRLEIFPLLIALIPSTWRKNR